MTNTQNKINQIKQKLSKLKKLDVDFKIFASHLHKYKLGKCKTEKEIAEFESKYDIKLPTEYRAFLKQVGDGGAGPHYGMEPLKNGPLDDLEEKSKSELIDPSKPFLFTKAWNFDWKKIEKEKQSEVEWDQKNDEYFDTKWSNGLLRICDFGWGTFINLVVNGKEHGKIWTDARINDEGIHPEQYFSKQKGITFLDWYEAWLDESIKKLPDLK